MSIKSTNMWVGLAAAAFTIASSGAYAQHPYDRPYDQRDYDQGGYDDRDANYDYARVVDVQPLTTRVRVTTPRRECWDETRVDDRSRAAANSPLPKTTAGGAVLGGLIGGVLGHQIGHGLDDYGEPCSHDAQHVRARAGRQRLESCCHKRTWPRITIRGQELTSGRCPIRSRRLYACEPPTG